MIKLDKNFDKAMKEIKKQVDEAFAKGMTEIIVQNTKVTKHRAFNPWNAPNPFQGVRRRILHRTDEN